MLLEKTCSLCGQLKLLSDFYVRGDGRQSGNFSSRCKPCVVFEATQRSKALPEDQMIRAAKWRAKKKGLPFDLDLHRPWLATEIAGGCALSGLPFGSNPKRAWDSPSLDRIRPELGYVRSNVRMILWCLNSAFGDWGEDQFEIVARAWLARREDRP